MKVNCALPGLEMLIDKYLGFEEAEKIQRFLKSHKISSGSNDWNPDIQTFARPDSYIHKEGTQSVWWISSLICSPVSSMAKNLICEA